MIDPDEGELTLRGCLLTILLSMRSCWTRVLVVGAGATGGYFGARLAQAGRDVTFLLRGARAADVRANGLRLTGQGAEQVVPVTVVTVADISGPYDLVLLAVSNGALDAAADHIAGAVGPGTLIVPFLNGMSHMDRLNERFGRAAVLGGVVLAARQLGERGEIISLLPAAKLTIGAQPGPEQPDLTETAAAPAVPGFDLVVSGHILADMWYPLPEGDVRSYTATLTEKDSKLTPSLYRDVLAGHSTESHYVLDDLARRARDRDLETPLLELAALQLRIYNARAIRARMTRGG
jgi:2-dehydropantoate 2-reductase